MDQTYSRKKRFFQYLISFLEALPFLILANGVKIAILNVNGFISDKNSILYIDKVAAINRPGGKFLIINTRVFLQFYSSSAIFRELLLNDIKYTYVSFNNEVQLPVHYYKC